MAHTIRDKRKLLNRVRRLRGQVDALATTLEEERDCADVLHLIAACRGALNGLMAVVLEGHVRAHVLDPKRKPTAAQVKAADELLEVVRAYLK